MNTQPAFNFTFPINPMPNEAINLIPFPRQGMSVETVRQELLNLQRSDWRHSEGRLPLHGYFASKAVSDIANEAASMFANTNALAPNAFPSCKKMEQDVVSMALHLLNGNSKSSGSITSGGTESIILSVKAARDKTRASRALRRPNIVVPSSAHPAFDKAAQLLDVAISRVPVDVDWRCHVSAMEQAIDGDTFFIAASAPSLPYGLIDPVSELSEIALKHGIWLHVDACIGGLLAPFVRQTGYPVSDFDFMVRGVRSISTDLHKFGYAAKGASLILYRDKEDHQFQYSHFRNWPKGEYITPTLAGTRSGGPIASAWAVMHFLGEDGYREITKRLMILRDRYLAGFDEMPELTVLGRPELTVLTVISDKVSVFSIADEMRRRNWYMSLVAEPAGIQQTVNLVHESIVDTYLKDLKAAIAFARAQEPDQDFHLQHASRVVTY
ncbi:glutamate/tyrosine decarboxylase-like PLP-dependent enzyme [Variovorax paradoxus]|uniref:pyridoxal phosphate-dependent decarboxylase family protein n=1 Tax=Variovorax paradoxus TaxID=34073 RepID=UPI001AE17C20|nr:aspartate aminotransferase family protein [Variovorax paradoxus]MDP9968072.1 glutamate/tyrosine decarboxylase-like PLP-dependent enzyme [Variovorax paradoxus]